MTKKIYIIILNYNGWKDTIECLESVLKNNYENYQIIVVDNDSPNNSIEYMKDWANGKQEVIYDESSQLKHLSQPFEKKPLNYVYYTSEEALNGGNTEKESKLKNPIIFIQTGENIGFAAGNNIGIKYAQAKDDFEYVWLLNNDTVMEKDSLTKLVEGTARYVGLAAVGSKILYYDRPNVLQNVGTKINEKSFFQLCKPIISLKKDNFDDGKFNRDFEVNDIMGASLLVSKTAILDVGLMPEEYFLYGEETDWNFNFQKYGYKLMTIGNSKVFHKKSVSTGGELSHTTIYYRTRNQFILNKKYMTSVKFLLFTLLYTIKKMIYAFTLKSENKNIIFIALKDGLFKVNGKRR